MRKTNLTSLKTKRKLKCVESDLSENLGRQNLAPFSTGHGLGIDCTVVYTPQNRAMAFSTIDMHWA